jgi:hypothetical protein
MKRWLVLGTLTAVLAGLAPVPARAGAATDAALALGAFAVFNQLFGLGWHPYHEQVVVVPSTSYVSPNVIYMAPPVMYAPTIAYAPPQIQREVVYSHGRYVLLGDGLITAYQWVWIPNAPPPPPPPERAP